MKINSCYVWGIDGNPVAQRCTEGNDVSCRIKVSVDAEPTTPTAIPSSLPVCFPYFPTPTALLACVSGFNVFNSLSKSFGFVSQELLELLERPGSQKRVESLSVLLPSLDVQFLKDEEVGIAFGYLFGNTMIDVSHKPSFSLADFFQLSFGGASACGLETLPQPLVSTFDSTNMIAVKKFVITCNHRVDDAPVDSNSFGRFGFGWSVSFSDKIEVSLPSFDMEGCGTYLPGDVFFEVVWNFDRDLDSAKSGGHRDDSALQKGLECVMIEADSRELPLLRQPLEFLPLEHITCLVSCSTNETTIELGELLPNVSVSGSVEFGFIVGSQLEPRADAVVAGHIVKPYRILNTVVQRDLKLDCSLHDKPLDLVFKYKIH